MNVNEVIANVAARRLGRQVHPNDQVNIVSSLALLKQVC
jgi:fumarate hydratase class II